MKEYLQKIDLIQRASLEAVLTRSGIPRDKYFAEVCKEINDFHLDADGHDSWSFGQATEYTLPLKSEEDWWKYRNINTADLIDVAAEIVEEAYNRGSIEQFNLKLETLCERLKESGIHVPDLNIGTVIRSIPFIHMSDPTFNALASRGDHSLPFPHIRSYFTTEGLLQTVAKRLTDWCYNFDNAEQKLVHREVESLVHPAEDSSIVVTLNTIIDAIAEARIAVEKESLPGGRGRTDHMAVDLAGVMAAYGARMMILLHEIAHHLLDHFNSTRSSKDQEWEADLFALFSLASNFVGDPAQGFILAGAELPFILMIPHSMYRSDTHPSPRARVFAVHRTRQFFRRNDHYFFDALLMPLFCCLQYRGVRIDAHIADDDLGENTITLLQSLTTEAWDIT